MLVDIAKRYLFARQCVLCAAAAESHNLCLACYRDLLPNTPACSGCGVGLAHSLKRCGACQTIPPTFTRLYAPYRYVFPLDRLIKQYKYSRNFAVLEVLVALTLPSLQSMDPRPDVLVPLPLHWSRLLRRGFNQCERLTQRLSSATGCPINRCGLKRWRRTRRQSDLDLDARQANVAGAFFVSGNAFENQHVLLIDDIATTAATAEAASVALHNAGASQVDVLVVARA